MSLLYVLDRDELPEGESPPAPDLRLPQARGLAESGQLRGAARMAAAMWLGAAGPKQGSGTRVLGYLLFGALLEDGLLVLARVVRCLRRVCDQHWEKMQPEDEDERKAALAEALGWLLSKTFNRVVVSEQAQDPEWAFLVGE